MNTEFPGPLSRGAQDPWVSFGADRTYLEIDAPHVCIGVGPLHVCVAASWYRHWRPRPWRSKSRRYREWLDWCQRIHTTETHDQHVSRAKSLTGGRWK